MDRLAQLYRQLQGMSQEQQIAFLDSLPEADASALKSYIMNNVTGVDPTNIVEAAPQVANAVQTNNASGAGSLLAGKFPGIATMFANLKDPNKPLINSKLNLNLSGANQLLKKIGNKPITEGGMKLGNVGLGLYGAKQGIDLFNEANNLNSSYTDLDDIERAAKSSAYANPMVYSYLNAEDQKTLRQLRNGSFGQQNPLGAAAGGAVKNIPNALKDAFIGYLVSGGNPVGAILGGGSALAKGGMQGISQGNQDKANRLQSLYNTLRAAEEDYNSMRRPSNLRAAGLSSRAYAGLY